MTTDLGTCRATRQFGAVRCEAPAVLRSKYTGMAVCEACSDQARNCTEQVDMRQWLEPALCTPEELARRKTSGSGARTEALSGAPTTPRGPGAARRFGLAGSNGADLQKRVEEGRAERDTMTMTSVCAPGCEAGRGHRGGCRVP